MGINLETYLLYRLSKTKMLLIRASRPGYNNANQNQENKAGRILNSKMKLLLEKYLEGQTNSDLELIGEFQGLPEGDILYEKQGKLDLKNLRYSTTRYGKNSIFISIANNEADFIKIISEEDFADNGWEKEGIHLPSRSIDSTDFITENDFNLSSISDAYTFDLEDKRLKNLNA